MKLEKHTWLLRKLSRNLGGVVAFEIRIPVKWCVMMKHIIIRRKI